MKAFPKTSKNQLIIYFTIDLANDYILCFSIGAFIHGSKHGSKSPLDFLVRPLKMNDNN
jgi:hypothetical protein